MPHIALNSEEPGIRGLLMFRPETGRPLSELAEVLLRGPGTLARGERELIAAYVSTLNDCRYCSSSHSACAAAQLPGGMPIVEQVCADTGSAPISAKLKALLSIASAVQQGGHHVSFDHVAQARAAGATDLEIHDTVLIAAAFCMFNRYVDGLATNAPDDPARYAAGAQRLVSDGYLMPAKPVPESQRPDAGTGTRAMTAVHDGLMRPHERLGVPAVTGQPDHEDHQVLPRRSGEDTDVGWGEPPEPTADERFQRDRPPHWNAE